MSCKSIGHVAFYTSDIEASLAFYKDVFGFPEAFRMVRDDGTLGGVYVYVAENQFLELFRAASPALPDTPGTVGYTTNAPGYAHICLHVGDVEAEYTKVKTAGAPIDVEIRTGVSKCRMFWTHDPDGNRIEVMELPPESLQAQATERLKTR
ncbi:MAG: VOC family protein [Oscillospiraceae bacterium]|nr:VOC family protein [Oscillospiraceae bacterium]